MNRETSIELYNPIFTAAVINTATKVYSLIEVEQR